MRSASAILILATAACAPRAVSTTAAKASPPHAELTLVDLEAENACEVRNARTNQRVARFNTVVNGPINGHCEDFSPGGTLVLVRGGRGTQWFDFAGRTTQCGDDSIVAPDDSTCITAGYGWRGGNGAQEGAFPIMWARAIPADEPNTTKVLTTLPAGRKQPTDGGPGFHVVYCSPKRAVVDIEGGVRIVVDENGNMSPQNPKRATPPCP